VSTPRKNLLRNIIWQHSFLQHWRQVQSQRPFSAAYHGGRPKAATPGQKGEKGHATLYGSLSCALVQCLQRLRRDSRHIIMAGIRHDDLRQTTGQQHFETLGVPFAVVVNADEV
jgi:hypothetical protein